MRNSNIALIVCIILCISSDMLAQYDHMRFKPESEKPDHSQPCKIVFDGYDQKLLVDKKEFAYEKLLGYTHPSIKQLAPDLELIEVFASTSIVDGYHFLDIQVIFHSPQAKANYGGITKNANIKIRFINDEYIYLPALKTDAGTINADRSKTIFKNSYQLQDYEIKMLKKMYVDELEVVWRFGLEKYPIENINLFRRQLSCLDGEK